MATHQDNRPVIGGPPPAFLRKGRRVRCIRIRLGAFMLSDSHRPVFPKLLTPVRSSWPTGLMTNPIGRSIISTEQEKNISRKGKTTMNMISATILYMSERQAIVEQVEYSLVAVRPYRDKQRFMLRLDVWICRHFSSDDLTACLDFRGERFFNALHGIISEEGRYYPMINIPTINLALTGARITAMREAAGLSVKDLQKIFGFNSPQAIYKWQRGVSHS